MRLLIIFFRSLLLLHMLNDVILPIVNRRRSPKIRYDRCEVIKIAMDTRGRSCTKRSVPSVGIGPQVDLGLVKTREKINTIEFY